MDLNFLSYEKLSSEEHIKLLEIRNLDYIRINMKDKSLIKLADHLNWVGKLITDSSKFYYAIIADNVLVGGVSITDINYQDNIASWGLFFKRDINPFISSFSAYLLIDRIYNIMNIEKLNLEVKKSNISTYKFDLNLGFKAYGEFSDDSDTYYLMSMTNNDWNVKKYQGRLKTITKRLGKVEYNFI